jgi:16S rRNA (guanine(966)-N(2))-methyltransferase RsmD
MRIITGKAKGRRLKMPGGGGTRPAMDKVKGSTFNILAGYVEDSRFLDLFAGSGNLGIEALSRGASYCAFVDASRECTKTIVENLELTRLKEGGEVFTMDCLKFLKTRKYDKPFDIVFIDPPYLKDLLEPILNIIPDCEMFDKKTLFIIERQKRDELGLDKKPLLKQLDERKFGSTIITFFKIVDENDSPETTD